MARSVKGFVVSKYINGTAELLTTLRTNYSTEENFSDLKKGIKLPKSPLQWSTANDFFKLTFSNHPIKSDDLNNNINTMATVIYNYFSENFGFVDYNNSVEFAKKLRTLLDKRNNTDQHDANTYESAEINHDRLIKINFWGYGKKYFKKNTSSLPTFYLGQCTSYFT